MRNSKLKQASKKVYRQNYLTWIELSLDCQDYLKGEYILENADIAELDLYTKLNSEHILKLIYACALLDKDNLRALVLGYMSKYDPTVEQEVRELYRIFNSH